MSGRFQHTLLWLWSVCFAGLILCTGCRAQSTLKPSGVHAQIVVNQIGYYPSAPKVALLIGSGLAHEHYAHIIHQQSGDTVQTIAVSAPQIDRQSGDTVRRLVFSSLQREGTYRIQITSLSSYPFFIGRHLYRQTLDLMLRSYYLQRCGCAIADSITGVYHPACHLQDGYIPRSDSLNPAGTFIQATGGWHDAGDYGKYMVTSAVTVGRLLTLFERFPGLFHDTLQIPESHNGIPDILDEARYALRWMLSMQRPDGAVYRKLSGSQWTGPITPQADTQRRYVFGISTPETAKFVAVMSIASRVYKEYQGRFADSCLRAALKAWEFLQRQSTMQVDWKPEDDGGSGKYLFSDVDQEPSLSTDLDDRFWAAVELYAVTKRRDCFTFIQQTLPALPYTFFEWKDSSPLAMLNYIRYARTQSELHSIPVIRLKIRQRIQQIFLWMDLSAYSYANNRIVWGSNKMLAEEAVTLLESFYWTRDSKQLYGALEQVHFLLGRNPFNISFISGVGTSSVRHICHLFQRASGYFIPGFLSGGPNELEQSDIAPKNRGLRSFSDDERSYATNENAIDYNVSMITLLAHTIIIMENEKNGESEIKHQYMNQKH